MSIFSKIGKGLKKVAKVALPMAAAYFAPQVLGAVASGVKGVFGGGGSGETPPNSGPQLPGSYQSSGGSTQQVPSVNIESSMGNGISSAMSAAAVGAMNMEGMRETNAANARMAQQQMDFQASQAQKQMDFQREQTSTSYQRGVKDLRAAGLNPMLAYTQGGASSGSGAMGTGASAVMGNELGAGANSALSAGQTLAEIDRLRSVIDNVDQSTENLAKQGRNIDADTANKLSENPIWAKRVDEKELDIRRGMTEWQIRREAADDIVSEIASSARLRAAQAKGENYSLSEKKAWSGFYASELGKKYPYSAKLTEQANSAANIARKFIPLTNQ